MIIIPNTNKKNCIDENFNFFKINKQVDKRTKKYRKLKICYTGSHGYPTVHVLYKGRQQNVPIHRLIAGTFIENPNNYSCVNHIDGNKLNNAISNLEWCTYSQNNMHAINTGLKKTGVDAYNSKFNKENILEIKKLFLEKISMKNIAKMYNVDYRTIWQIKNEKSYKNIKLCQ
jgi:hypothetical protein